MASSDKGVACLLVRVESPSGCECPWIFVELGTEEEGAEYPRTPDSVNGLYADDLCLITIVSDYDDPTRVGFGNVEYRHAAYVDTFKAERMVKTLRTVTTRMHKLASKVGDAACWAENVGRFAHACGSTRVAFPLKVLRQLLPADHWCHEERTYTRGPWLFFDLKDARPLLDAIALGIVAKNPSRKSPTITEAAQ